MTNPFGNPYSPHPDNLPPSGSTPPSGVPGPGGDPHIGWQSPQYPMPIQGVPVPPQPYAPYLNAPKPVAPLPVTVIFMLIGVAGAVCLLGAVIAAAGSSPDYYGGGSNNSSLIIGVIGVITSAATLIALIVWPGRIAQTLTTVLAALWVVTCVGVVIAVPVLVLLWLPEPRAYFTACDDWRAANGG